MPVDYNNMVLFDPVASRMQGEQYRAQQGQMQQRNALAQLRSDREGQALDFERQQIEASQRIAQEESLEQWAANGAKHLWSVKDRPEEFMALADQYASAPEAQALGITRESITPESVRGILVRLGSGDDLPADPIPFDADGGLKIGNFNPGDYTPDSFARFMQSQDPRSLQRYVTPIGDKVVIIGGVPTMVNPRGGDVRQLSTQEAELGAAQSKAAATAIGTETGKMKAGAVADLPRVAANADDALAVLDQLNKSPGFNYIYGAYSLAPIVPGTRQADADALLQQVEGKAFLEAFNALKGGGQITEKEGEKATSAITRLTRRKQQPSAARQALRELQGIIKNGLERAKVKAGQQAPSSNLVRYDANGKRL